QNQVRQRKGAPETEAVGYGPAKNREKPYQAAEQTREIGGALGRKRKRFVEITGKRGERGVVTEAFEEFADVRDPEGAFEAGANFGQSLSKTHKPPHSKRLRSIDFAAAAMIAECH